MLFTGENILGISKDFDDETITKMKVFYFELQ